MMTCIYTCDRCGCTKSQPTGPPCHSREARCGIMTRFIYADRVPMRSWRGWGREPSSGPARRDEADDTRGLRRRPHALELPGLHAVEDVGPVAGKASGEILGGIALLVWFQGYNVILILPFLLSAVGVSWGPGHGGSIGYG